MPLSHVFVRLAAAFAVAGVPVRVEAQTITAPSADDVDRATEPTDVRYFTAKLSAGATARNLYDNLVYGADFMLALGSNTNGYAGHYYACVSAIVARTRAGLDVEEVRFCALHEWSVDRWRFGFSPELGLVFVHRVTRDAYLRGLLFGLSPHVSVDLVQFLGDTRPPGALFLSLRGSADWILLGAWRGAGTLALGVRY